MANPLKLIERYQSKGILVDSNLLLLYFVGLYDPTMIQKFKRTRGFIPKDFVLLRVFLEKFQCIVTTPNIMSEVSNLAGQMGSPAKEEFFLAFAKQINVPGDDDKLDEQYVASRQASRIEAFVKVGLTDSAIIHLAKDRFLVLTDDFRLAGMLGHLSIDAINFNHLRSLSLR